VLRAHCDEQAAPPSRWGGPDIPPALDEAVLGALSKRPAERPATAAAFAEQLAVAGRGRWHRTIVIQHDGEQGDRPLPGAVDPTLDCTAPMSPTTTSRTTHAERAAGVTTSTLALLGVLAAFGGGAGYWVLAVAGRPADAAGSPVSSTSATAGLGAVDPSTTASPRAAEGLASPAPSPPERGAGPTQVAPSTAVAANDAPSATGSVPSAATAPADRSASRPLPSSSAASSPPLPFGKPKF
jgi:serine/threonine-protein kinase